MVGSLLTATACGHPVQRTLEGRWMGESVENFEDEDVAAASGWARGTSFEFAGTELTVAIPAEEPRSATYRVVGVHQKRVRLAVVDRQGQTDELRLILDDESSLRWLIDERRAVVLRRQ